MTWAGRCLLGRLVKTLMRKGCSALWQISHKLTREQRLLWQSFWRDCSQEKHVGIGKRQEMLDKDVLSKVLASARSYQQLQSVDYTTEVVPPRGKGVGPLISLHRFWGQVTHSHPWNPWTSISSQGPTSGKGAAVSPEQLTPVAARGQVHLL